MTSATIPAPNNRWQGANRGAWSSSNYDTLYRSFNSSLDPDQRAQQMAQAMKLVSEELPVITLYYDVAVVAHVSDVTGPRQGGDSWNIHEWELK